MTPTPSMGYEIYGEVGILCHCDRCGVHRWQPGEFPICYYAAMDWLIAHTCEESK